MLFGYIYTQNSNNSQHPLRAMLNTANCTGCEFIRTADDNEQDGDNIMHLDLDPGTSDMILIVHQKAHVKIDIGSKIIQRQKSRNEVL